MLCLVHESTGAAVYACKCIAMSTWTIPNGKHAFVLPTWRHVFRSVSCMFSPFSPNKLTQTVLHIVNSTAIAEWERSMFRTQSSDAGRKRRTSDGFEQHMGVNHLGHFALTMHLLPLLRKSAKDFPTGARIVNVSSMIHILSRLIASDLHSRKSYSATTAYANSKCAQIMFTRVLRVMLADEAVHVFAVHPGMVLTEISRDIPAFIYRLQRVIMPLFLFTSAQGNFFHLIACIPLIACVAGSVGRSCCNA
jgi:NAD(P)-dependent dehydrogenase (short-subunit alcohol dehydrogenase family)